MVEGVGRWMILQQMMMMMMHWYDSGSISLLTAVVHVVVVDCEEGKCD